MNLRIIVGIAVATIISAIVQEVSVGKIDSRILKFMREVVI